MADEYEEHQEGASMSSPAPETATAGEASVTPEEPIEPSPPIPPPAPPQAEPGVYLCVAEIAGEHAILGILTEGQEYDYTQADPRTLQAVAAYVELGVLEKM